MLAHMLRAFVPFVVHLLVLSERRKLIQNSNLLPASRLSISPSTRRSSASSFARNVTLNRTYAPASSQGTVLISLSVIIHWLNDSAFSNATRLPSFPVAALGALTYRKNEPRGLRA